MTSALVSTASIAAASGVSWSTLSAQHATAMTFVSLGTGTTGDVYNPVGAAICGFAN